MLCSNARCLGYVCGQPQGRATASPVKTTRRGGGNEEAVEGREAGSEGWHKFWGLRSINFLGWELPEWAPSSQHGWWSIQDAEPCLYSTVKPRWSLVRVTTYDETKLVPTPHLPPLASSSNSQKILKANTYYNWSITIQHGARVQIPAYLLPALWL